MERQYSPLVRAGLAGKVAVAEGAIARVDSEGQSAPATGRQAGLECEEDGAAGDGWGGGEVDGGDQR